MTLRAVTVASVVLVALVALPLAVAGGNDEYPLFAQTDTRKGSAGPRVCDAQWLSMGKRPSVYRDPYFVVRTAAPTCYAGVLTGRQWKLLKFKLGAPTSELYGTFGQRMHDILTGKIKRPTDWVVRAIARRNSGVVLAKSYPLASTGRLIGFPFTGTHTLGNYQSDNAVDITCSPGERVLAPIPGRLFGGYGALDDRDPRFLGLRINMAGQYRDRAVAFYLAHMRQLAVPPFAPVKAGQLVGYCGSANGIFHLHLGASYGFPVVDFVEGRY